MRAVVLTRRGPPDVLRVQERPDPMPGAGQVRIRVEAAGVNFADLLARAGLYPDSPKTPCVLGYEVAGAVDTVGPGVEGLRVGDRVLAGTRFNGQAELAVVGEGETIRLPDGVSMTEAAAIPINYATAYAGLVLMAGTKPGERVLIHSAAGGVGSAAVQIARYIGATVIGTASAAKHEHVRSLGASDVIDYRNEDVGKRVRDVTSGEGVDVIFDASGPRSFRTDWGALREGGRLVMYGMSQVQTGDRRNLAVALRALASLPFATMPWWKSAAMLNENKGVFGLNLLHWWDREKSLSRVIGPLRDLMQAGVIRPVVDSTFDFDHAPDAHRRLMSGASVGKVVLTPH